MSNLENPGELIWGRFWVPIMNITRSTSKSLKSPVLSHFFSKMPQNIPYYKKVEVEIVYSITFKLWKITEITHFLMIFAPKSLTEGLLWSHPNATSSKIKNILLNELSRRKSRQSCFFSDFLHEMPRNSLMQ